MSIKLLIQGTTGESDVGANEGVSTLSRAIITAVKYQVLRYDN